MSSRTELVMAFLNAWDDVDMETIDRMMSPDIVYKNTGYPDAFGREGVRKALASLIDAKTPLTTIIHAIAETADGVVMTERTDTIHHAKGPVTFPVMGAFDVKDGQITGWRDYFDASLFKAG